MKTEKPGQGGTEHGVLWACGSNNHDNNAQRRRQPYKKIEEKAMTNGGKVAYSNHQERVGKLNFG